MSCQQTTDEVTILETREASPTHFLIKVESFSLLRKHEIHKYETGEFSAGGHKWRLVIYHNEDKPGADSRYLSVYLAISDKSSVQPANWEVNVVFSIFLFNQISGNYHYSLGRTRRFQAMKPEWGISKFISKKVLTDPSNGFLIDDNCVFGAEVFIVEKCAVCECLSLKDVTVPYKNDFKISNFSKLEEIWISEQFDVQGINWKVRLRPKGSGIGKGSFLAIYLSLIDSKRVKANYSICIKDQTVNNPEHQKKTSTRWFSRPNENNCGWAQFIELAILEDPENGFIVNDCCLLEVEISVQAVV